MRRFDRAINFSSSTDLYGDILTFAYGVNLWNVNAYCATVLCLFPLSFFCTVQHSEHHGASDQEGELSCLYKYSIYSVQICAGAEVDSSIEPSHQCARFAVECFK